MAPRRRAGLAEPGADRPDRPGDVEGRGGAAGLVVHHRQGVALGAEAQHGADEVGAPGAEDPGRAEDDGARVQGGDGDLAGGLGGAVDAYRSDRVILAVGPVKPAVEDVVRGDVDEGNAALGAGPGEGGGAQRIGRPGLCGAGLRGVHRRPGAGVDDGRPGPGGDPAGRRGGVGKVELGPGGGHDLEPRRRSLAQGASHLSGASGQEQGGETCSGHGEGSGRPALGPGAAPDQPSAPSSAAAARSAAAWVRSAAVIWRSAIRADFPRRSRR